MIDLIGHLIIPSGILVLLTLTAITSAVVNKRILAVRSAFAALGVYIVFGNAPVAYLLLGPLERTYLPVADATSIEPIQVIVVLTGYASRVSGISPPSWLNTSSAYRILEAQWLIEHSPESTIIISGTADSAETMRDVLLSLGYKADKIVVDRDASDTALSASYLALILSKSKRCALITSAGHMPRAMASFKKVKLDCMPVPTEYYTPFSYSWIEILPTPKNLRLSDLAVHEYIGILWYYLIDKI